MTSVAGLALALAVAAGGPRLEAATALAPPTTLVGGGLALVALRVEEGRVAAVRRLQGAEAFLDRLAADAVGWRFEAGAPAARVLVVGVYRPPQLLLDAAIDPGPTHGEAASELPLPEAMPPPAYPPHAIGDGAVVVQVEVDDDGRIAQARVVGSASGFDAAALQAARGWRFRPARRDGRAVAATACLVFAFREPVTPDRSR